jgi:hypothetical protein
VVGITKSAGHNLPSNIPRDVFHVNQDSLQLDDCKRWVCVVQLNCNLIRELGPRTVGLLESPNDIVQRSCDPEILLLQSELLTGRDIVVGVQNRRNCFGPLLIPDRSLIVTGVELLEVEFTTGRLGGP